MLSRWSQLLAAERNTTVAENALLALVCEGRVERQASATTHSGLSPAPSGRGPSRRRQRGQPHLTATSTVCSARRRAKTDPTPTDRGSLSGGLRAVLRAGSLAKMPEPRGRFLGRLLAGRSSFPTERDWERSVLLEPRAASRDAQLISDGAGLPFSPGALSAPAGALDEQDPAVGALIAQLARQKAPKDGTPVAGVNGWRVLARTDEEVLFGRGRPPQLITIAMRHDARRHRWMCHAVSAARPLRVTRDGIRASDWRLDPDVDLHPEDTVVRVLVTEQTWAGGKRADRRLLAPDLHVGAQELVLTMFVTPPDGFQIRSPNPETPARIALPGPIGQRSLIDGALYG